MILPYSKRERNVVMYVNIRNLMLIFTKVVRNRRKYDGWNRQGI